MHGGILIADELLDTDPIYDQVFGTPPTCNDLGNDDTNYHVYEVELIGPGPHDLTVTTCGVATWDSVLTVYQEATGLEMPFEPALPCDNRVGYNDDACGLQSTVTVSGLVEGFADVVLTGFSSSDFGAYDITYTSTTNVCAFARVE